MQGTDWESLYLQSIGFKSMCGAAGSECRGVYPSATSGLRHATRAGTYDTNYPHGYPPCSDKQCYYLSHKATVERTTPPVPFVTTCRRHDQEDPNCYLSAGTGIPTCEDQDDDPCINSRCVVSWTPTTNCPLRKHRHYNTFCCDHGNYSRYEKTPSPQHRSGLNNSLDQCRPARIPRPCEDSCHRPPAVISAKSMCPPHGECGTWIPWRFPDAPEPGRQTLGGPVPVPREPPLYPCNISDGHVVYRRDALQAPATFWGASAQQVKGQPNGYPGSTPFRNHRRRMPYPSAVNHLHSEFNPLPPLKYHHYKMPKREGTVRPNLLWSP